MCGPDQTLSKLLRRHLTLYIDDTLCVHLFYSGIIQNSQKVNEIQMKYGVGHLVAATLVQW